MSETVDVLVLGTGAAGLTAALAAAASGMSVRVLEKSDRVGGTTAISGGMVWIPNHKIEFDGPALNREDALTYMHSLSLGYMDDGLVEAFVDAGPEVIDFVEEHTDLRFYVAEGFPDYNPEHPGGRPGGGRSLNTEPFPFDSLGEWSERVLAFPAGPVAVGFDAETQVKLGQRPSVLGPEHDHRVMGAGLVGGLLKGLLDLGVEPELNSRARSVVLVDGRVAGVTVTDPAGDEVEVLARRGVIIATGGFDWDKDLVRAFLRGPVVGSVAPPLNEGDGLKMSMQAGAQLATMQDAWWTAVVSMPDDEFLGRERFRSVRQERTRPGCIMVNAAGRRFVNEATDYHSLVGAFHHLDPNTFRYPNLTAWMVFDARHFRAYGFMGELIENDPTWFVSSPTPEGLGAALGVPAGVLAATIDRWNEQVDAGRDTDFLRGDSAYDTWWGDASRTGIEQTLGRIDEAPFYAVPVGPGLLGTKGGPRIDPHGRVIGLDGTPVPGLFAAGNAAGSPSGIAYAGAGATIGPAMVFGYRAAMALSEQPPAG
ncbi:FAD-dependent oxidoreductase [Pseudonocardia ailaonensis]|uniref:FAD-dependent oxidoreductase n=1 Tax=Pseudonocardia ailaonensis TaxID=367279 RepID=A0ABN2N543_9PSEU